MEVAASVVGLLMASAKVSSVLQQFITGSANAPALALNIAHEINDFRFILSKLQRFILGSVALNPSRASLIHIDHLSLTLAGYTSTLSELEKAVDSLLLGKMDFVNRMKWSWAERDLTHLVERLQQHKSSLTLVLTILAWYV